MSVQKLPAAEAEELRRKIVDAVVDAFDERDFERLYDDVMLPFDDVRFSHAIGAGAHEHRVDDAIEKIRENGQLQILVRKAKEQRPGVGAIFALPSPEQIADLFGEVPMGTPVSDAPSPAQLSSSLRLVLEVEGDQGGGLQSPGAVPRLVAAPDSGQSTPTELPIDRATSGPQAVSGHQLKADPRVTAKYSAEALRKLGQYVDRVLLAHCSGLESFAEAVSLPDTLDRIPSEIEGRVVDLDDADDLLGGFAAVVVLTLDATLAAQAMGDYHCLVEMVQAALPAYDVAAQRVRAGELRFDEAQIANLLEQSKACWEMRIEIAEYELAQQRRAAAAAAAAAVLANPFGSTDPRPQRRAM